MKKVSGFKTLRLIVLLGIATVLGSGIAVAQSPLVPGTGKLVNRERPHFRICLASLVIDWFREVCYVAVESKPQFDSMGQTTVYLV